MKGKEGRSGNKAVGEDEERKRVRTREEKEGQEDKIEGGRETHHRQVSSPLMDCIASTQPYRTN